ncbi:LytR/AlgR family response regulator transcription factor [Moheibacter sediminis]|uniref:Two component transcriptional regulator, LytTR family n=1 Tax=Moheibacter sediminis TaxID=1434700 RepID=A0A1W1YYF3_9FLAO|nr:response regulator transcription factor [Moheibacter sediminis]SMC41257.1 two component transcriptional regulator, LytTR family [Moheibacter sediminis]
MKRLSAIAVDDEAPALRRLIKMIEGNSDIQLIASAKSALEAKKVIIEFKPDLLLLDIQLKDATAFDLLSEIKNHFYGKTIFITAYDQYAIKAFEYEAIDYLLKPYTQERFNSAISRIISKQEKTDLNDLMNLLKNYTVNSPKMLAIPEGVKNHFIEKEKLQYIISEGYYCSFISSDEKKLIRISLKKLEEFLPEGFMRINKSTIINKDFIMESSHHKSTVKIIMSDQNEFYVSENFIKNFQKEII